MFVIDEAAHHGINLCCGLSCWICIFKWFFCLFACKCVCPKELEDMDDEELTETETATDDTAAQGVSIRAVVNSQ